MEDKKKFMAKAIELSIKSANTTWPHLRITSNHLIV